jgi:hypothetical protein
MIVEDIEYILLIGRCVIPSIIGYLSSDIDSQNIQVQIDRLKAAGASKNVQEKPVDKPKRVERKLTCETDAEPLSFF